MIPHTHHPRPHLSTENRVLLWCTFDNIRIMANLGFHVYLEMHLLQNS